MTKYQGWIVIMLLFWIAADLDYQVGCRVSPLALTVMGTGALVLATKEWFKK